MYFHGTCGDIVTVLFPYREKEGAKVRPALIIREDCAEEYYLCQITTKNKSDKFAGKWITEDSPEDELMGIIGNSFVNYENRILLNKRFVFKKIGNL